MGNTYTYKRQGDGRDSWQVTEPNGNKYMVYEDPNIVLDKIDEFTEEELDKLAEILKTRLAK